MKFKVTLNKHVAEKAKAASKALSTTPDASIQACLAQARKAWGPTKHRTNPAKWYFDDYGEAPWNSQTRHWFEALEETTAWIVQALEDVYTHQGVVPQSNGLPESDRVNRESARVFRFLSKVVHALQKNHGDYRINEAATIYAEYLCERALYIMQRRKYWANGHLFVKYADHRESLNLINSQLAHWLRISARIEERLSRLNRESAERKKAQATALCSSDVDGDADHDGDHDGSSE
jgi:hypothetical protein